MSRCAAPLDLSPARSLARSFVRSLVGMRSSETRPAARVSGANFKRRPPDHTARADPDDAHKHADALAAKCFLASSSAARPAQLGPASARFGAHSYRHPRERPSGRSSRITPTLGPPREQSIRPLLHPTLVRAHIRRRRVQPQSSGRGTRDGRRHGQSSFALLLGAPK